MKKPAKASPSRRHDEARAAAVRLDIRKAIVLNAVLRGLDRPAGEAPKEPLATALAGIIDEVLNRVLHDLGSVLADAAAHRRRAAKVSKPPTAAELEVARRLKPMRQQIVEVVRDASGMVVKLRPRSVVQNPVATLTAQVQAELASLAPDHPERAALEAQYNILRRGSTRVLEICDRRVKPVWDRREAEMERDLELHPPESDE